MFDGKFKSDSIVSYVGQIGTAGFAFLYTIIVTRYFGVSIFGALTILTALTRILSNLITIRTNEAVVNFYARGEADGNLSFSKFALFAGTCVDICFGLGLFLLVFFNSELVATRLLKDFSSTSQVRLYAVVFVMMFIRGTPYGYLQAKERIKSISLLNFFEGLIKVGVTVYFVFFKKRLDLHHAVLTVVIPVSLISLLFCVILLKDYIVSLWKVPIQMDGQTIRQFFVFSLKTFLSTTLKAGNQNIDTLVLGYISQPHTVGIYGLFKQFLAPLPFMSAPLTTIIYPKFVKSIHLKQTEQVRQAIVVVNRKLAQLYGVALAGIIPALFIYGWWIQLQWQLNNIMTFIFLVPVSFINGTLWWVRPFSNALDPVLSVKSNLCATLIILIFIYPLTYFWGIAGTALCVLVVEIVIQRFWMRAIRHYL